MKNTDLQKQFPIISMCRADLQSHGFTEEQIALLADDDMRVIAQKLAAMFI